jgi:hypothetical protein
MILTILLAGSMFAAVFVASGGLSAINALLEAAQLGAHGTLAIILFLAFLAGFMLDPLVIILVIVPIASPIIKGFGFDIVWFCVVFPGRVADRLSNPADGAVDLLSARHRAARDRAQAHVHWHLAVHCAAGARDSPGRGISAKPASCLIHW